MYSSIFDFDIDQYLISRNLNKAATSITYRVKKKKDQSRKSQKIMNVSLISMTHSNTMIPYIIDHQASTNPPHNFQVKYIHPTQRIVIIIIRLPINHSSRILLIWIFHWRVNSIWLIKMNMI